MTALEQLAGTIAACEASSDALRDAVELHLVDTVGAWIASTRTAEGLALLRFRAALRANCDARSDIGIDLAVRCALTRLSEVDDIHLPSMTTPSAVVIPGTLTLAATLTATTSDEVSAAIIAGIEAMTRLGRALDGPAILYRGIWPTYLAAPVGVAAAAARLLKLDQQTTANALALALTLAAPGVGHHNAATTARWLAVGQAACNGLVAARAAQQGFTSDLNLFEGPFLRGVYGLTPQFAALTERRGERPAIMEVSFKPWCAARQTMAATQALREIMARGVEAASIDAITAFVLPPHLKMIDHGVIPGDRASHLTSVQYGLAAAALAPELALDLQQAPRQLPPALRDFMGKIEVAADESLLADYPRAWPARVRVIAGSTPHEQTVTHVPGDPARPFDRTQVSAKFLRLVKPVLGAERAERLLALCHQAVAKARFDSLVAEIEQICRATA